MKRPLWLVGMIFLLSIRVAFYFSSVTAFIFSLTFFFLALIIYVAGSRSVSSIFLILFSCSLGFAVCAHYNMAKIEPFQEYKGQLVRVEGIISEVKRSSMRSVRYNLVATFPELGLPSREIVIRDYIEAELKAGDSISTVIELADPKYETTAKYYDQNGIVGEGVLLEQPTIVPLQPKHRLTHAIIKYREKIYSKNIAVFSGDTASLVNSMVFGITGDMDSDVYTALNRTGISHLISISGLHLSIFSGFIVYLLSFFGIGGKAKYLITIAFTVAFSFFVGLSPPIIRALIMTIIYLFGKIIDQQGDSLNTLGLSAIITGFIWPVWAKSLGLWLSYLATAGIIIVGLTLASKLYSRFKSSNRFYNRLIFALGSSVGISFGAYIFTLPVLFFTFGWVSLISPLTNLLVAPFASFIIIIGLLCTLLPQGFPFYPILIYITEFSSKMIFQIALILSRLSFSVFSFNHIFIVACVVLCTVLVVWLIFKQKIHDNILATALAVALIVSSSVLFAGIDNSVHTQAASLNDNQLVISRGDSAVVFVKNNKYSVDYVLDYLDYKNIRTISALVCLDYDGKTTTMFNSFASSYNLNSVISSGDTFVLETLAVLLPGTSIYSSENANLSAFGNTTIDFSDTDNVYIYISNQKVILSGEKYDIMSRYEIGTVYFLEDLQIIPENLEYKYDFLGNNIYDSRTIKV